jgi:hypothetical protein
MLKMEEKKMMQFIIESGLSVAIFTSVTIVLMIITTVILFYGRQQEKISSSRPPHQFDFRWNLRPSRWVSTLIAFSFMILGFALVGAWYYIRMPIISDYDFNLMAVAFIAAILAVVAAYGIALNGLYAKTYKTN